VNFRLPEGVSSTKTLKRCEGCQLKQPNFGLQSEGKARWCSGCAKAHVGTEDLLSKKCEGCGLKVPNFGLPVEGKKRWCAGCAKALIVPEGHAGAVSMTVQKKCEDCGLKQRTFGLLADGKMRWCAGCAKGHTGSVDVKHKKCEGYGLKHYLKRGTALSI
jgi:hypothetical protein